MIPKFRCDATRKETKTTLDLHTILVNRVKINKRSFGVMSAYRWNKMPTILRVWSGSNAFI